MNYSILRCVCYVPEQKMAPVPRTMLLCCIVVAFVSAVFPADGADLLQAGDLRITFPGSDWKQADPPAELQRSYQISPSNVRLVFHAISTSAQLRFHIVEVDFSGLEATNKPIAIAGLLDGVKRRCQRQASGAIHETNASSGEIHFTEFEADLPGVLFLKIRNLLCSDKVYLLEIGGPKDSRAEADEVIAGVLVGESKALASQAAKSVSEIRRSPPISPEKAGV